MRMSRRVVVCVLMILAGCEKAPPVQYKVNPWPLKQFKGFVVETEHYLIHTTVDDPMLHRACAALVEGQYERFSADLKLVPKLKMKGYIFANRLQWEAFTNATMGPRAKDYLRIRDGGYSAKNICAMYYLGRYPTLSVLGHEVFHQYLNCATDQPIPAWLNEGLSCYYEAHEWDQTTPLFTPQKNTFRRETLADAVQAGRLFPLKALLATHAGEVSKLSQAKVGTYYSQVWALMRFLREGEDGTYAQPLRTLLDELGTRDMKTRVSGYLAVTAGSRDMGFGEAVFRVYITEELDRFEQAFTAYVNTLVGWQAAD